MKTPCDYRDELMNNVDVFRSNTIVGHYFIFKKMIKF